jgi:hypothetical protein
MEMMTRPCLLVGMMVCAALAISARVVAQPNLAAEVHNKNGKKLFSEGRLDEAIAEYRVAYALTPAPKYLFNIGLAYHRQGKKEEALEYYRRYLLDDPNGVASDEARLSIAALERQVAQENRDEPRPGIATPASTSPPPAGTGLPAAGGPATAGPPAIASASPAADAATVERGGAIVSAFGPKAGILASVVEDPDVDCDYKFGTAVGGFVSFSIADWLGIDIELLNTRKGCRNLSDGDPVLSISYLEMPILLRPTYRRWFVEIGGYLSVLLSSDLESVKTADAGLVAGVGRSLAIGGSSLIVEARYEFGLTSIVIGEPPRNRAFVLSAGYSFR